MLAISPLEDHVSGQLLGTKSPTWTSEILRSSASSSCMQAAGERNCLPGCGASRRWLTVLPLPHRNLGVQPSAVRLTVPGVENENSNAPDNAPSRQMLLESVLVTTLGTFTPVQT